MPTNFYQKLFTIINNYYFDAQVFETWRMSEMFWCLLSQFLCDKSQRKNKYLDICFVILSNNWKQNSSVARATFLLRVVWILNVMQRLGIRHDKLIVEPLPSVNLQFECVFWKKSGIQEVNWQDSNKGVLLWLPVCTCILQSLMLHFVGEKASDVGCEVNISHVTVISTK